MDRLHSFLVLSVLLLFAVARTWADDPAVRLELASTDIQAVTLTDTAAWLKLAPAATAKLEELTRSNQGRWLIVAVDGIQALRSRIVVTVDSGVLQIASPSPDLRLRLQTISSK